MIDETRIEPALREGPPFRTRYVQRPLPLPLGSETAPHTSSLLAVVVVAVLLVVAFSGGALIGSGVVDPPVLPVQPGASTSPENYAQWKWTATGSMSVALDGPAVLLADGGVLVAGGYDEIGMASSSAALYHPRTGSWTDTDDMIESRGGHTATLLPDGTVLVAGGQGDGHNQDTELASAELYHPLTGTWTATGTMIERRNGHTATLLPDGTVLVAGGSGGAIARASAELYDPRTGSWTAAGSMIGARAGHTATLLPDGTVLVAGGSDDGRTALVSAELYDPRTGSWTATEGMKVPRLGCTATLLNDGTVLVAGGESRTGGEVYDPGTGSWTATGEMAESRGFHAATLLPDGRVLMTGGANGNGDHHVTNTAELYDPGTGSWTATDSLLEVRKFHQATLLTDGTVLVSGGTDGPTSGGWHRLATAELYGPASGN